MTITFHERPAPEPAYLSPPCADCWEPLGPAEEDACHCCGDPLCDRCFRYGAGYCLSCPSEPEERGEDWWRALMENGDVELSVLR